MDTNSRQEKTFRLCFIFFLALLPVIAVEIPRFLAFAPSIIGLLFGGLYWVSLKEQPLFEKQFWIIPLGILALASLSLVWSIAPEASFDRLKKLAPLLLGGVLCLIFVKTIDIKKLKPHLWLIPAGILTACVLIFIELKTGGVIYKLIRGLGEHEEVPRAVYNRASITAALLMLPSFYIACQFITRRTALILFISCYGAMLLCTDSQATQLAVLLALFISSVFPFSSPKAWKALKGLIVSLMMFAPFLAIQLFKYFAPTLDQMPLIGKGGGFAGGRLEIWDYISRYSLENPFYGYGLEATKMIKDFDSAHMYHAGSEILHPHNFALQLWIEFGIMGAALGSAALVYILYQMHTSLSPEQNKIVLPVFVTAIFVAAITYGLWQSWWIGLLFITASLCMIAVKLQEQKH